jgi:hypothetical protein
MMPDTEELVTQQPDFVRDEPGDTEGSASGSDRDEGGEQFVPPEQWLGEPDYLEREKQDIARGFLAALVQIFAPKPLPNAEYMELTEERSASAQQSMERLRDTLRYLGTTSIKVTDVPAKRQKLYKVTAGTNPIRLAGFQANRKKLVITNIEDADSVYLAEDETGINTDVSYELIAGSTITINAQGEVWVQGANDGDKVNVQAEFYE